MAGDRKKRKPMAEINVVPYIDVMLVLMVVFMITAPMLTEGIRVELPKLTAKPVKVDEEQALVVSVKSDGSYYINLGENVEKAAELAKIATQVSKVVRAKPNIQVLVRGDQSVPYGKVVELMAVLQKSGVPNVGLITEPEH
ncbi:MAG: protein TolR [Pseudomonadales bacterium]|nr:protein TolR [Pseudomonadales bacterium]